MTPLARLATSLAASTLLIVIALPVSEASAQQKIPFDCGGSKTVAHELGVTIQVARFESKRCICADTAEAAKARAISLLRGGSKKTIADAGGYSRPLQVDEGKTATATIYCYDVSVLESLAGDQSP